MLYLEDFIEMIENLPQELRDRLTEMREMDLAVQNSTDNIEKRVNVFFSNIKKMKPSEKEAEYEAIRKDYYKTLEDADEKVHLANQMHDLVDRYSRLLDQELFKFKVDLEADNKGITEILEKRSLELDQPSTNSSQKENRYSNFPSNRSRDNYSHSRAEKRRDSNASSTSIEKRVTVKKVSTPTNSNPEVLKASANSGPPVPQTSSTPTTAAAAAASPASGLANSVGPVSYNLGHIGAGGNAIAAAASQAIAATQHMQQGRRTASLKASYEAINTGGVHAAEFSRELAGAAQTAIAAIQESSKKNKKKVTTASVPSTNVIPATVQQQQVQEVHQQQQPVQQQQAHQHQHQHHQQQQQVQQQQLAVTAAGAAASAATQIQATTASTASSATAQATSVTDSDNPDWTFDPNEPRYCICNQVSYGDMVACDNSDCPFEWFHYPCVNITAPPKGKWYCPQCTSSMKRRGGRKN